MIRTSLPDMNWRLLFRALLQRSTTSSLQGEKLGHEFELPMLDAPHMETYKEQMGFRREEIPLTYFYLLAQRAQLSAMLSPHFGFRVAGLVHVSNDMSLEAEPLPSRALILRTSVHLEVSGDNGSIYVMFHVRFVQGGRELVLCTSRYLAKRGSRSTKLNLARDDSRPRAEEALSTWNLPTDMGRRYARLSGDYNPIHLWQWSASLLGFKRPIIHGMYSVGRAAADIENSVDRPVRRVTTEFLKPLEMGSTVALHFDPGSGIYELWSGTTLAVRGTIVI